MQRFEKHILIQAAGKTALEHLYQDTDLSKQQIKQTMQNGAVWLETARGISRIRRAKKILHQADQLHLYYDESIQQTKPDVATLIADEDSYSIWNKPYGMYSQGSKWGDHCTIYRWAEKHLRPQRPAFLVHRLDRAANGLILIAHKKNIAAKFSAMFKQHTITKKYRLTVEGILTPDTLPYTLDLPLDNKPAVSEIIHTKTDLNNNTSEIELSIKTGRKHQIRRHLAAIGYPVIGDRLYGSTVETSNCQADLQLSAIYLSFICPVGNSLKTYKL